MFKDKRRGNGGTILPLLTVKPLLLWAKIYFLIIKVTVDVYLTTAHKKPFWIHYPSFLLASETWHSHLTRLQAIFSETLEPVSGMQMYSLVPESSLSMFHTNVIQQAMICLIFYFLFLFLFSITSTRNCKSGNVKRKCQGMCVIYVLGFFHGLLLLKKYHDSRAHWKTSHSWLGCSGVISCKPSVQVYLHVLCNQRVKAEWLPALHSFWCQKRMYFTQRYK